MKQRPLALMLALLAGVGLIASQASAATLSGLPTTRPLGVFY